MIKLDILAVGVHPDDVELSCSGTLLKHQAQGKIVGLLDLTQGELGTRGNATIRLQEATVAAQLMGNVVRETLDIGDGFFTQNEKNLKAIIKVIRKYQPEIVLANAIHDRHPDHGRAAKLTADACFLSGLIKVKTKDEQGKLQTAWRPKALYHYIQDFNLTPDFVVDISPYIEKKMDLILAYKSQFYNPDSSEPNTPISGKAFLDFIYAKNKSLGRVIGADYAEGFNVSRTIGVENLFDLR